MRPFVLLFAFLAVPAAAQAPAPRTPDVADAAGAPSLILHDADVFTADPANPRAQALAIAGDRIVAVGTDAEVLALAGPETAVLDLDGRLVVPGINDAHVHVGPWPAMRRLGLSGQADPEWATVLDSVRAAARAVPAATWIQGSLGGQALDDPAATRFALDAVAPEHPVMLSGWTGHGMVLNTAALRALGLSEIEPDRPGGWFGRVAGTDTLDGRLWEYPQLDVIRRISDPLPRAEAVAAYRRLSERLLRWGVTSVQQMENDRPLDETLAALAEADLPLRWGIFAWPMPAERVDEPRPPVARPDGLPARVRVVGTKWMLDGTPVERGAALRQPYADRSGWSGRVNFTPAEVRAILQSALDRDEQTALHIVGDATLALVLETMADLAPAEAWRARRVRIEHGEGLMPDLLPRAAAFGMVLVQNPLHFAIPDVMAARYGPDRVAEVQLLRSAAAAGVPVALGADAGGSGQNPWLNLMMASLHPVNPAEALSREDALVAYTRGSAYAEGMEHEKGALAPGMLADLAVLSQNVLEVPPDALPGTESVLTMVGGAIVHRAEAFGSAAEPRPAAPLLHTIDHFYAGSEEAEGLFRFFRDSLGLAQAWPYRTWDGFASGGISLGNTVLEFARWEEPDGTLLATAFSGIAFEPVEHAAGVVAELERRRVPHSEPAVYGSTDANGREVGWTLIDFSDLSAWGAMVCDYHDRESIAESRGRAHARLSEQEGGPLGIVAMREIVLGATDVEDARAHWRRLIDAPKQETAPGVFVFGPGPAVRVVPAAAPAIEGIVVAVRSLAEARAFLAARGWLREDAAGEVTIAPGAIGGLSVLLVEP